MNAGKNYEKAKAQAQANADRDRSPRWLHWYGGAWWISRTSVTDGERVAPQSAGSIQHSTKKSAGQLNREIAEFLRVEKPHHRHAHAFVGRHVMHQAQHWEGSEIQSLLFDKQWTVTEAKDWAHSHGYKSGKAHVTDNYIRLRQFEPVPGTEKRTITLGQGIKAVIEQVK